MATDPTLLLTRPQASSERFAQQLFLPLNVVISPLLEIRFRPIASIIADHVVFTSRNGVEAWARAAMPSTARCFCVGEATGDAAREIGFDPFVSGGTVKELALDIVTFDPKGTILHVRGQHTRGDLVRSLRDAGLSAESCIAYDQLLLDLGQDVRDLIEGGAPVIVPLFSPRSAAQFTRQALHGTNLDLIAISEAAAAECPAARVATFPNAEGMVAAIAESTLLVQ